MYPKCPPDRWLQFTHTIEAGHLKLCVIPHINNTDGQREDCTLIDCCGSGLWSSSSPCLVLSSVLNFVIWNMEATSKSSSWFSNNSTISSLNTRLRVRQKSETWVSQLLKLALINALPGQTWVSADLIGGELNDQGRPYQGYIRNQASCGGAPRGETTMY